MPACGPSDPQSDALPTELSRLDHLVAVFMCHIKIQSYHIDLRCYAMRCYAMLCYIMLCYAMLCFALLCCAMLCVGVPCYALPFYACYAMLCLAVLSAMPSLQLQLHFCMFGAAWPRTILKCVGDPADSHTVIRCE